MVVVVPTGQARRLMGNTWSAFSGWERTALAVTVIICILCTRWLSRMLDVPRSPEFAPSLLLQSGVIFPIVAAFLMMAACAVIGSIIAGHAHHDAGIFAAGIGLATLSARGGPVGIAYRQASGSGVFGILLLEVLLLGAGLLGIWAILHRLRGSRMLRDESIDDLRDPPVELDHPSLRDKFSALAVQTIITLLLVWILQWTDAKKQVTIAMLIGSFLASVAAHHLFPIRGGLWFWCGPLLVGVLTYASALIIPHPPELLQIGQAPTALANAAPLDFAGIGVSASIFGYWASRRWHRERAALAQAIEASAATA